MCLKEQAHPLLLYNIYIVMKKICFMAVAVCGLLSLNSCNSCSGSKEGKSRDEQIQEFRSELNKEDTATMLKLCDDAMEELKNKKYDQVLASLYEYTDSTKELKPLSKATANKYRRKFMLFPVLEYHRIYYSFQLEGCNDVKYDVTWATAEKAGTAEPAKTAYMFNPVKINGEWKLCVKTADDEIDKTMR